MRGLVIAAIGRIVPRFSADVRTGGDTKLNLKSFLFSKNITLRQFSLSTIINILQRHPEPVEELRINLANDLLHG